MPNIFTFKKWKQMVTKVAADYFCQSTIWLIINCVLFFPSLLYKVKIHIQILKDTSLLKVPLKSSRSVSSY